MVRRYGNREAAAFAEDGSFTGTGFTGWRDAVARHLAPRLGMRVLDLGAGTGGWARAFAEWYGVDVVAVEPSAALRMRSSYRPMLAGDAAAIPLADTTVDGAWISAVIRHLPDLPAVAAELRRVLRPGAPVLIRSVFAGRPPGMALFRYFPEAVLDAYPSVAEVCAALATAGFEPVTLQRVPQVSAPSLRVAADGLRRAAHPPLVLITDDEYADGVARLRADAERSDAPVVDSLDLLVLR